MDYILRVDINIFAFILLTILLISVKRNADKHLFSTKIFMAMLYVNASLLLLNTVLWFLDGKMSVLEFSLNNYLNFIYHLIIPLSATLWLYYVDYHIFADENRLKKRSLYYSIPLLINAVLVLYSLKYGLLYYFNAQNVYVRGSGFAINYILTYGVVIYTWVLSYRNRRLIDSRSLWALQFFIVPILVGAIIQLFIYGLVLTWPSMSVSLLIVFISIEMRQIYRDYLTGAHSRRQLDDYIIYRTNLSHKSGPFAIAMIDMDDFKEINDTWGHHAGDEALVTFVKLIKDSVRRNDFVARYAGDEFVIVFDVEDKKSLDEVIERINRNVQKFNDTQIHSYQIKFSIGAELVKQNESCDSDEIFKRIDRKMYEEKRQKKKI